MGEDTSAWYGWIVDVVTVLVPLAVLWVTLCFNKRQNELRAKQEMDARRFQPRLEACANVIAECEQLDRWAGSEHVALYDGPEPEPWDIESMIAPLRAAVAAVELIGRPETAAAGNELVAAAIRMVEGPSSAYRSFVNARTRFVGEAQRELGTAGSGSTAESRKSAR